FASPRHADLHSFPTRRSSDLFSFRLDGVQGILFLERLAGLLHRLFGGSQLARHLRRVRLEEALRAACLLADVFLLLGLFLGMPGDRKSTRLNSSHQIISYAVF